MSEENSSENKTEENKVGEIEKRASMQGWVPKEEFKGDPERWTEAEDWVERADTMMPIMKSVNAKHEAKITAQDKEIADLKKTVEDQKVITKKMAKIQGKYGDDFYDTRIAEIKAQKLKAVEAQDTELFKQLEDEQAKLKKPEPVEIKDPEPKEDEEKVHPEVARWQKENTEWYGKDDELTEYADIIAAKVAKDGHSFSEYQFCEEVKKKVKTMFPDKFKNPNAGKGSGVDETETRGSETTTGKKHSFNNLDAEAKKQCANLIATIPGYTKEKYVKEYFEGE